MRNTALRQQDLYIDTLKQGDFRPRQTERFTESDSRAAYLGRRRRRVPSLHGGDSTNTLLLAKMRAGGALPSLLSNNGAGSLTLSPSITPLTASSANQPFHRNRSFGSPSRSNTISGALTSGRNWGTSAPTRGLYNLEPDPFADEEEEPCVHCPGSVSGAQGSDLMSAKRRMKRSSDPLGSPFSASLGTSGFVGGLGSRPITYSGC